MNKKIFILAIILTVAVFAFWKKEETQSTEPANKTAPILVTETAATKKGTENTSAPLKQIQAEVEQIKTELSSIDVSGELNNPDTPGQRRQQIIKTLNLYSKKLAQLAKLQIAEMEKEVDL